MWLIESEKLYKYHDIVEELQKDLLIIKVVIIKEAW